MPMNDAGVWTPHEQKQVEWIAPQEMIVIAQLARLSPKHDIGIHCSRCEADFVGRNATTDGQWAISCGCRELRSDMGRPKPAA